MKKRYHCYNSFRAGLLIMLFPCLTMAQGTIRGTVTSAQNNEPLPGVNILFVGTQNGTASNVDGEYEIQVSAGTYKIEARYLGFDNLLKTVTVSDGETVIVDFEMSQATTQLNDVVVTALGISREQRSIGYANQEVDGDNLTVANSQNVIGSLAGKIAGVQVIGASGASMGGTQKIKIRGVNSLNAGDEPLIVVDGTPISNANFSGSTGRDYGNLAQDVNPDDIESINVLKGPAASALYGIRGQFGVIMINTKKGVRGAEKFTVELNSGYTIETVTNIMPYQNKYGAGSNQEWNTLPNGDPYVSMIDESWGPRMDGTPVRQFYSFYPLDPQYGELTPFVAHPDNIKNYYETGTSFNQGVSVYGGGERTNFRISFNNTDINGVEPNTFLNRNNIGVAAGANLSEKWSVSANMNFATNDARRPSQGAESGSRYFGQWFERNIDMNRLKDYEYEDGTILHWNLRSPSSSTGEISNLSPLYFNNPYFAAYENFNDDDRDRIFGNVGVTFKVLPELILSGFLRTDRFTQNLESRWAFGGTGTPSYSTGKYQNRENNFEFLAQYEKVWDELSLNATLGSNIYDRYYNYVAQSTSGGLSAPGFYNIDASIDRPNTSSYLLQKQVYSTYGLVSFGYSDTYFIDVSLRNDKSSALPESNNSYWYPSVSGSFVFSELLDIEQIHLGKLRLSFAQAGSDLSPYRTMPFYSVGTVYDGVSTLSVPNNISNPNIKPAFSTAYEAGIDLNFFSRIDLSFTYYNQQNENQIIPLEVSGASGYSSTTINAGLIENKGFEISLGGAPVQSRDFLWNTTFNIARNQSMVVELYEGIDVYGYGSTRYSGVTTYLNSYEGKPFGTIVGQAYQRDDATGKILLDEDNLPLYTDATHNFGSALPEFTGGLFNTFNYKGFELNAMIDFQIGGQFFSRSQSLADRTGLSKKTAALNDKGNNVRDPIADGGGVKVTGISAATGEEVTAYVDAKDYFGRLGQQIAEPYIYDASYLKLRELSLGYNLKSNLVEQLSLQSVRVSIIARNPLMIWQSAPQGLDPSELSTGSQSISWYESGQLNTVRSIGFDINITF